MGRESGRVRVDVIRIYFIYMRNCQGINLGFF